MNVKQILCALSVAGCSLAAPAMANDYHYGDVTGISVTDTIYEGAGPFLDNHFFSISTPVNGFLSATALNLGSLISTVGLSVSLWADVGSTVGSWDAGDTFVTNLGTGNSIISTGPYASAGNYFLQATGLASGTGFNLDPSTPGLEHGGYYFSTATVPVPEPETWAMLLAGVGLVGLKLRRKSSSSGKLVNI